MYLRLEGRVESLVASESGTFEIDSPRHTRDSSPDKIGGFFCLRDSYRRKALLLAGAASLSPHTLSLNMNMIIVTTTMLDCIVVLSAESVSDSCFHRGAIR